jgi:hypothetical protein
MEDPEVEGDHEEHETDEADPGDGGIHDGAQSLRGVQEAEAARSAGWVLPAWSCQIMGFLRCWKWKSRCIDSVRRPAAGGQLESSRETHRK